MYLVHYCKSVLLGEFKKTPPALPIKVAFRKYSHMQIMVIFPRQRKRGLCLTVGRKKAIIY